MAHTPEQDFELWRKPTVKAKTGQSDSQLYREVKEGTFPKPVKIGPRATAWISTEVIAWMHERIRESRGDAA